MTLAFLAAPTGMPVGADCFPAGVLRGGMSGSLA